jgi:alpha-L-fucosidase
LPGDESKSSLTFTQNKEQLRVTVPGELKQPRVTVVVLELADQVAKVIDETLQQQSDGVIKLPVAKCEYAIRRISYDYENQVTHRWGEDPKQGLIWTVNVSQPGEFKIVSEDNGDERLQYELITADDTCLLDAKGQPGKKQQKATIHISKTGIQKISVCPKVMARSSSRVRFKGLELKPL